VEHLREFGALMLAIEHRYYGCHNASACPYTATDTTPLRWLSSRQALADVATFHAHISAEFRLPSTTKWVTFGGSYPGMLASWARLLYPSLIHASISSSAPVHAKLDMPEYNNLVARAYSLPSVGGSAACRDAIATGHAAIGALMQSAIGRSVLVSKFASLHNLGAGWLEAREHRAQFAGGGVASFPAQSNDPSCRLPGCSVGSICTLMASAPGSAVDKLAALARAQLAAGLLAPLSQGAAEMRAAEMEVAATEVAATEVAATEAAVRAAAMEAVETEAAALAAATTKEAARAAALAAHNAALDYWGYQTCTEFGFYQTCELGSGCFFTQGLVDLNGSLAFCDSDYAISRDSIVNSISRSNAVYGGLRPDLRFGPETARRVLYVNGDVDPWSALAILRSPQPEALPAIANVSGASHHAWTHPSQATDQRTVVEARKAIVRQLRVWLE